MIVGELDIEEFRGDLHEMGKAIKENIKQNNESSHELKEILSSFERLETELKDKKTQQLFADFIAVFNFIEMMSSEDEDEDEDYFDYLEDGEVIEEE